MKLLSMLDITLYTFIITIAIVIFKKLFHKSISPRLQYGLWWLLVLRLLVPFTLESGLHLDMLLPAQTQPQAQTAIKQPAANPPVQNSTQQDQPTGHFAASPRQGLQNAGMNTPNDATPIPEIAAQPAGINWPQLAAAIWAAGSLATTALTLRAKRRYNKRMLAGETANGTIFAEYADCASQMGIRPPQLRVVDSTGSPALTLINGRMNVLVPACLASNTRALRYAITHELTHCKRRDMHMCVLLAVLRCVYWFNPTIHYAFRQMKLDMETACDYDVMRGMDKEQRREYSLTLLDMITYDAYPALSMAGHATKRMAVRRINGLFMRGQSKRGARATALVLVMAVAVGCFTTAYQPTPEKQVVDNKSDTKALEDAIQSSEAPGIESYEAEEHWSEEFAGAKKLKVVVDADIHVPDVDKYPVMRVKDAYYTQEEADRIIAYLSEGKELTAPKSVMTKQEIMDEITLLKRVASEQKKLGDSQGYIEMTDQNGETKKMPSQSVEIDGMIYGDNAEVTEQRVAEYQKQYKDAPEVYEQQPAVMQFRRFSEVYPDGEYREDDESKLIYVWVKSPDRRYADSITISNNLSKMRVLDKTNFEFATTDYLHSNSYEDTSSRKDDTNPNEPNIETTREQALQLAVETLEGMEIEDMVPLSAEKGYGFRWEENGEEGWYVRFVRQANGVPFTASGYGGIEIKLTPEEVNELGIEQQNVGDSMAPGWSYESLTMSIDDSGVTRINWYGKTEVIETENEDVQLLPFDDVKAIIRERIPIATATYQEDDNYPREDVIENQYIITSIELGMTRVAMKDNHEEFRFIPVWDVFGYSKTIYDEEKLRESILKDIDVYKETNPNFDVDEYVKMQVSYADDYFNRLNRSIITVNAIDGTIIDRSKGH